jgi:putative MATE family efflux protein
VSFAERKDYLMEKEKNSMEESLSTDRKKTEGVNLLTGDPRKAIVKLALPIMFSLFTNLLYNLVNGFWVAGLGNEALASVGTFFLISIVITAIFGGFSNAGVAFLSRFIGAGKKADADKLASQIVIFYSIIFLVILFVLYLLSRPLFLSMGLTGQYLETSLSYARIMYIGIIFMNSNYIAETLLRSEGSTKIIGILGLVSAILNALLDPIFIYGFDLRVEGAGIATVLAIFISFLVYVYIFFIRKRTYLQFNFKIKNLLQPVDKKLFFNISKLGLNLALGQLLFSLLIYVNTIVISKIDGIGGVTIYTIGQRWIAFSFIPLMGIASVLITIMASAFGSKNIEKINIAFNFSLKLTIIIEIIIAILTFIFSTQITYLFTWSDKITNLEADFILFLTMTSFLYPAHTISIIAASSFAGLAKGSFALLINVLRTMIITFPCVLLFTLVLNLGLRGVWIGIVVGNYLTAAFSFFWILIYKQKLKSVLA